MKAAPGAKKEWGPLQYLPTPYFHKWVQAGPKKRDLAHPHHLLEESAGEQLACFPELETCPWIRTLGGNPRTCAGGKITPPKGTQSPCWHCPVSALTAMCKPTPPVPFTATAWDRAGEILSFWRGVRTPRDNFFAHFVGLCRPMEESSLIYKRGRFPCISEPGVPETDSNSGIKTVQRFLKTFHSFQSLAL